ncbi:MAG: hypothetical protein AAGJ35_03690, partial [Myxococcota bacterium]
MGQVLRGLAEEVSDMYDLLGSGGQALQNMTGESSSVTRAAIRLIRCYTMMTSELSNLLSEIIRVATSPSGLNQEPMGVRLALQETKSLITQMIERLEESETSLLRGEVLPEEV